MKRTPIVTNEYISIDFLPEHGIIHHTVHKPIEAQLLKDSLNKATEFLKQNRVTKWLSDDRKNGPLSPEVIEWGFKDWNQRAINAGWKYWANVVPEEVEAAGTLTPTINDLHERGLRMMVFTNVDDALEWLISLK
jgi:hypothetical protein